MKIVAILAVLTVAGAGPAWAAATSCEGLTKLKLAHTEVTSATLVDKGAFPPPAGGPGGGNNNAIYATLPAFCRVVATSRPTNDSEIGIEVWLPAENWNGRLEAVGNGALSGNPQYSDVAKALQRGYAAVATNTGHAGNNGTFAVGHQEKMIDWGSRAVHEMTVTAKKVIAAHYGKGPAYSYWNSCSTGGRQGWVAAEYYPNDFDGLAIGDPANPMTRLQANNIYINLALNSDAASFIPQEKWNLIHQAFLKKCDALDGVEDGLVQNPMACNFDFTTLVCKSVDAPDCLTQPQLEAMNKILTGSKNPRTGEQLYPGYPPGLAMLPGPVAGKNPDGSAPETFRMLFQDANWDFRTFDFDKDTARADKLGNSTINAVNAAKLSVLFAHGGKILMYHGWDDTAISPLIGVDLYKMAVAANGGLGKTDNEIRFFMVPGMGHCTDTFDRMAPLSEWVEHGKAPDSVLANYSVKQGTVDRKLLVCAYPKVAKYNGSGDFHEPENFTCTVPQK